MIEGVAIVMVFTSVFPVPILLAVFGGLLGGSVGERMGLF